MEEFACFLRLLYHPGNKIISAIGRKGYHYRSENTEEQEGCDHAGFSVWRTKRLHQQLMQRASCWPHFSPDKRLFALWDDKGIRESRSKAHQDPWSETFPYLSAHQHGLLSSIDRKPGRAWERRHYLPLCSYDPDGTDTDGKTTERTIYGKDIGNQETM